MGIKATKITLKKLAILMLLVIIFVGALRILIVPIPKVVYLRPIFSSEISIIDLFFHPEICVTSNDERFLNIINTNKNIGVWVDKSSAKVLNKRAGWNFVLKDYQPLVLIGYANRRYAFLQILDVGLRVPPELWAINDKSRGFSMIIQLPGNSSSSSGYPIKPSVANILKETVASLNDLQ